MSRKLEKLWILPEGPLWRERWRELLRTIYSKYIRIDSLWKSTMCFLLHIFEAFLWFDGQISKLYNTNNTLNVTKLLTTIMTLTKQTKSTSIFADVRRRPITAEQYYSLSWTAWHTLSAIRVITLWAEHFLLYESLLAHRNYLSGRAYFCLSS